MVQQNNKIFPNKLSEGDQIRVISPARSLSIIAEDVRQIATQRFKAMGLNISYSKNAEETDMFVSSSVKSRVQDIHDAFSDPDVHAILTTIGGYSCNELLDYLDYDLIASNPKILCGFSDITALANAIYEKTNVVTYSGTHYSSWGMLHGFDYSAKYFKSCLMQDSPYDILPSEEWSDDAWYLDQDKRSFISNSGHKIINHGKESRVEGTIIGGNLGLLNILQGSQYFPNLDNSILFLEHCAEEHEYLFNRGIQSLIHQPSFKGVKAIVIGRFQKDNNVSDEMLTEMILSKRELADIPVISGVDFGHTTPIITFPIGGECELRIEKNRATIRMKAF